MIKSDKKVICVVDGLNHFTKDKVYHIYYYDFSIVFNKVRFYYIMNDMMEYRLYYQICNNEGKYCYYYSSLFLTIEEYRNVLINKILS
jgi:hypothetical protein